MAHPFITDAQATQKIQESYNDIVNSIGTGFQGTIKITDTKTEDGVYTPEEEGTYTNAGGLTYLPESTDKGYKVTFIKSGSEWFKDRQNVGLNLTSDINTVGNSAITAEAVKNYAASKDDIYEETLLIDKTSLRSSGFIRTDGSYGVAGAYRSSEFIDISDLNKIKVTTIVNQPSVAVVVFYDENEDFISAIPTIDSSLNTYIVDKPINAIYARFSNNADATDLDSFSVIYFANTIKKLDKYVNENSTIENVVLVKGAILANEGFLRSNGTENTTNLYRKSDMIDISGVSKMTIHTIIGSLSVSPAVFYDKNQNYIYGVSHSVITETDIDIPNIPANAMYMVSSGSRDANNVFSITAEVTMSKYLQINPNETEVYISPTGDDITGNGTKSKPFGSYEFASTKVSKNGTVIFLEGDYLMDKPLNINTELKGNQSSKVRLIFGEKITTSSVLSGFTRVNYIEYSESINPLYFLWQHDTPDTDTEILSTERHPLQKGLKFRLGSTRLYNANSIQEIEDTTDRLMWFLDNGNLYFSKKLGSNLVDNPIIIPASQGVNVLTDTYINNIDLMYAPLNTNSNRTRGVNISSGYCNSAGSLIYSNTQGNDFTKCEFYANYRDGANGHSVTPLRECTRVTESVFNDCWFHDNGDDGESCHEYSENTHNGSLVEYNAHGITTAYGGHTVCYNSMVRRSGGHKWTRTELGFGFSAVGNPTEGESTDIYCYGCVSENNGDGFLSHNIGNTYINCISINNTRDYVGGRQINCVSLP